MLLAIESSCDETSVSVFEVRDEYADFGSSLKSCRILSQDKIHQVHGGVVPELASRHHLINLPVLIQSALDEAGVKISDITSVAVTTGPGLKGCLLVGVCYARGLAASLKAKLISVNHLEGHVWSPFLEYPLLDESFISVVVSGGHTQIVLVEGFGRYKLLANTRDDAAGEAFDKCAKIIGLPYPGGALLSKLADQASSSDIPYSFPIGMQKDSSSFSYSGLKTAFLRQVQEIDPHNLEAEKPKLAYAVQKSIVEAIVKKTEAAVKKTGVKNVALCGGVAANSFLRSSLQEITENKILVPSFKYCTDNSAMIGVVALMQLQEGGDFSYDRKISVKARLPLPDLDE